MYEKVRELLKTNRIVKFAMHGEEASFHENSDGEILFTVGDDNIICYAPDVESAIDCLMDECGEDELEISE